MSEIIKDTCRWQFNFLFFSILIAQLNLRKLDFFHFQFRLSIYHQYAILHGSTSTFSYVNEVCVFQRSDARCFFTCSTSIFYKKIYMLLRRTRIFYQFLVFLLENVNITVKNWKTFIVLFNDLKLLKSIWSIVELFDLLLIFFQPVRACLNSILYYVSVSHLFEIFYVWHWRIKRNRERVRNANRPPIQIALFCTLHICKFNLKNEQRHKTSLNGSKTFSNIVLNLIIFFLNNLSKHFCASKHFWLRLSSYPSSAPPYPYCLKWMMRL